MNEQVFEDLLKVLQPGTKAHGRGNCIALVSPPNGKLGWHMSISCSGRDPTWKEIKSAWYSLIPDADKKTGAMFFPPKDEYVNLHEHCFHIHEVDADCKEIVGEKSQKSL